MINKNNGGGAASSGEILKYEILNYTIKTEKSAGMRQEEGEKMSAEKNVNKNCKIMIMDDEEFIIEILSDMLEMLEYETLSASDGDEALEILKNAEKNGECVSACFLDLTIPGGRGGEEIISEIKEIYPETAVFASSGAINNNIISNPGKYGFSGYLKKPFKIDDLSELLENI